VNSLYAFDALARAAKSHSTKKGLVGDINAPVGNSATFLLKLEGVLDGLFLDLATATAQIPEIKVSAHAQLYSFSGFLRSVPIRGYLPLLSGRLCDDSAALRLVHQLILARVLLILDGCASMYAVCTPHAHAGRYKGIYRHISTDQLCERGTPRMPIRTCMSGAEVRRDSDS